MENTINVFYKIKSQEEFKELEADYQSFNKYFSINYKEGKKHANLVVSKRFGIDNVIEIEDELGAVGSTSAKNFAIKEGIEFNIGRLNMNAQIGNRKFVMEFKK